MRPLAAAFALLLAGCAATDPPAADEECIGGPIGGECCEIVSFSNILGVIGVTGYNVTWEPDAIRADLANAGFTLDAPEFGVRGQDPAGANFSFVQSGDPRARYLVTYESGAPEPHSPEAADRLWNGTRDAFQASAAAFDRATGYERILDTWQPLVVSGTGCRA